MTTLHTPARPRLRRWLIAIALLLVLFASYAAALHWATLQIGGGVQDSLRTAPVLDDHTPRIN